VVRECLRVKIEMEKIMVWVGQRECGGFLG